MEEQNYNKLKLTSVSDNSPFIPPFLKKPFSTTKWRYVALVPMNLLLVGYFASYDSPQPLQTAIKQILGIDDEQYSYFYSLLAVPNIILPLFAGYLVDSLGVRPSMITFATLVLLGQSLLTIGAYFLSFKMMIFGRIVFALGADPLNISQMVMTNRWFKGREVGFALSLAPMIAGGSKALNSFVVPNIFDAYHNLHMPLAFGACLCLISELCALLMITVDKIDEDRVHKANLEHPDVVHVQEKVRLKDIKKFSAMVWLLVINFGLVDGLTFTLRCFMNDMYHTMYNYSNTTAGYLVAVHYIVMSVVSPITGKFVDKYGYRASIMFYNSFLGIASFSILVFVGQAETQVAILPLILMGIFVGVDDVAVIPAMPLVLQEKYLGTGYGLSYTVVNSVLFVLPWTCGFIKTRFESDVEGYYWMNVFLLVIAVITTLEAFIILVMDCKTERVLDKHVTGPEDEHLDGRGRRKSSSDLLEVRL